MSFKDSMIRGLATLGANTMIQHGMSNGKMLNDILKDNESAR
ncbi:MULTISPECIES: hypothetical protein [Bifidobacterium]|uniref:Uncharacterized protein n=1 Tax=Bifidobacterium olomucense TaxID=2675324 RepID=A0A7Y0EWU0_9BIFI|nr:MULTISPECIES: hypothetical protein [Bifidobacterium]NMM97872.1 hypothetical protein [Bifidobacterium sp. DSM 109959]